MITGYCLPPSTLCLIVLSYIYLVCFLIIMLLGVCFNYALYSQSPPALETKAFSLGTVAAAAALAEDVLYH